MPVVRFGLVSLADQRWQHSARRWRRAEEYVFDLANGNSGGAKFAWQRRA